MLTEERYATILRILKEKQAVTVPELTRALCTSESTIRRDLTALHKRGMLYKVYGGATCIDPTFANLFETTQASAVGQRPRELTEREIYVLKSVAFGKSLKEIGLELSLSSKTIETYKARGSSKLNLQGRRAIVEYAIRNGWVQSEERFG